MEIALKEETCIIPYGSLDQLLQERDFRLFPDEPEFAEFLDYNKAYHVYAESIPQSIEAVQITDDRKRLAIIARSAKEADKWQASYFDQRGAYGDSVRNTRNDCIVAALEMGFTTIASVL